MQRQPCSGLCLAVLIDVEVAEDRAQRIRAGRMVDVAVRRERDFEASALWPCGSKCFGIAVDEAGERRGLSGGRDGTALAPGAFRVAKQLQAVRQLEPRESRVRPFVNE